MKKKINDRKSRQSPKSSLNRATGRKKLFSKRRGGMLDASMIIENRSTQRPMLAGSKKDPL